MASGVIATQSWLHQHGFGSSLARKYQQSGWIERIGHGALRRRSDSVDWLGRVFGLQQDSLLKVWPGGQTFHAGAKRILLPMASDGHANRPGELFAQFQTSLYSNPADAAFKALWVS